MGCQLFFGRRVVKVKEGRVAWNRADAARAN